MRTIRSWECRFDDKALNLRIFDIKNERLQWWVMGIRDKFKSVTGENSGAGRMLGTGRRKAAAAGITAAVIVALAALLCSIWAKAGIMLHYSGNIKERE